MDPKQDTYYRQLDALDAKCAGLLQLSSVMLVFIELRKTDANSALTRIIAIVFLIAAALALFVLWFKNTPTATFVSNRCAVFNVSVVITSIGCALTLLSLFPALVLGS